MIEKTEEIYNIIAGIIIIAIPILIYLNNKKRKNKIKYLENELKKRQNESYLIFPYLKKDLLTQNEYNFYKELKPIAEKNNLTILSKIRIADLIKTNNQLNEKEEQYFLNKIMSKHVDFALSQKNDLSPQILIELNDKTHENEERKERDKFLKTIFEKCGYKILFVYSAKDIEEKIEKTLKNSSGT